MAPARSQQTPVGSAQWLLAERRHVNQLVVEGCEEFAFSANEQMEWLNEHMHDVFNRHQVNVADVFKTPGKLRGKTPRTARKRPLENRAPLTDIFAPNTQAGSNSPHKTLNSGQKSTLFQNLNKIQIAADTDFQETQQSPSATQNKAHGGAGKENIDSGYYGTTQEEMDVDAAPLAKVHTSKDLTQQKHARHVRVKSLGNGDIMPSGDEGRVTTDESFVSANEEVLGSKAASKGYLPEDHQQRPTQDDKDVAMVDAPDAEPDDQQTRVISNQYSMSAETASAMNSMMEADGAQTQDDIDEDVAGSRSTSEGSSPVKPLVRKSSLTFAALPAREPLATKKSVGARVSRTSNTEYSKSFGGSQYGRATGGKSIGGSHNVDFDDPMDVDQENRPPVSREDSETTKLHNKTSTQRLHERINMLGQSKETGSSRSLHAAIPNQQPSYPQLPAQSFDSDKNKADVPATMPPRKGSPTVQAVNSSDDEEDWIAPVSSAPARPQLEKSNSADVMEQINNKTTIGAFEIPDDMDCGSPAVANPSPAVIPSRPGLGHHKSASASALSSPAKSTVQSESTHHKAISVSNPEMPIVEESTTPAGSPNVRRHMDGPLSASKAKLFSVLKSAKGIFASSAGVSAQAKMEALSPVPTRPRNPAQAPGFGQVLSPKRDARAFAQPDDNIGRETDVRVPSNLGSPTNPAEGRRTRSSTEREQKQREKEAKEQQRIADDLERAREKERQKAAAAQKQEKAKEVAQSGKKVQPKAGPQAKHDEAAREDMPPPPPPKSVQSAGTGQKLREPRRLAKPSKETLPRAKPAPVSIRTASQRINQQQPAANSLSQPVQDAHPPAPPPKQQNVTTKASNTSLQSSNSATSYKVGASAHGRPRALIEAEKKKQQEERAAQRKAEQKREAEQRRKQEEERREQQRKAEQLRVQEARKTAQKRADDVKRQQEQQRAQAAQASQNRPQSRHANEFANMLNQEKVPAHPRSDLGNARPLNRMHTVQDATRQYPPVNQAKPAKRPHPEQEYGQDNKRRKTIEEDEPKEEASRRSVMAPPTRPSNIRKEPNKFQHGYIPAPSNTQHAASLFKSTVTGQHHLAQGKSTIAPVSGNSGTSGHPNDMVKYSNAKIPFAEAPNPPPGAPGHSNIHSYPHKTPVRAAPGVSGASTAPKSSPNFPAAESVQLPDINTDSEDSDSSPSSFKQPSWVASPALNEILAQQQLVDPETIFGPIAPLQMEEIFKNKDRQKRFRDRTSSANWSGSDRLTEEERKKDREGRAKLVRDGGWTYAHGLS
ncbi:hypothetical protein BDY21DRAFT_340646 [Lineolata rhizophorae]|uniref:Inner centromere protein ARK-binding domain-containing protein n=1 Tax=Lineolata rhizophorae TaxID=578093 RepID=A0A6A6P443_9PEZI|nr:hypothetical protein BDY21DRAFT_340646 [Lineolata rhizophorae]